MPFSRVGTFTFFVYIGMKRYLYINTIALLLSLLTVSCGKDADNTNKADTEEADINGVWQWREVNNGVVYKIEFKDNNTINQLFSEHDGRSRLYLGGWERSGHTLKIRDQRGEYMLLISEYTDSTMVLLREDSMALVFDRVDAL